jgi:hypothetical protein
MSHTAHNLDQEFWRPPVQNAQVQEAVPATEVCSRCNTGFVIGSRFCHVCGAGRDPQPQFGKPSIIHFLDLRLMGNALGLNVASFISFIVGIVCMAAAFATGFIYTATTVLDWQAVQIWRIEWLLAAAVAFIAGILLKRTSA